ncbi:hypothetical protein B9Z55_007092 [Caenorhabditis nigoni]|uniref:CCHC-type domain-containing protein n=1 Tax=Caenorhabditis nigoni TaxID=1611254 RepID=A0A2G5V7Y8_9PELO|nr:hypothetical protein B9Z55_007092 [Caenorhabditis nigoni]
MSVKSSKRAVTIAFNALKEQITETEALLTTWKKDTSKRDLDAAVEHGSLLNAKVKTLESATDKLEAAVEGDAEMDDAAVANAEDYMTKAIDLLGQTNTARDKMAAQKDILLSKLPAQDSSRDKAPKQLPQGVAFPKIPRFKGDKGSFSSFWTVFEEVIHKADLSNVIKMTHLQNYLEGEARELIRKFRVADENYELAVEVLQKKYNNKKRIVIDLHDALDSLKAKTDAVKDQRELLEQLQVVIKQLEDHDQTLDILMVQKSIIRKFSRQIQERLYDKKLDSEEDEDWTIATLITDLEKVITKQEKLNENLKANQESRHQSEKKANSQRPQKDTKGSSSENPKESKKWCVYCGGKDHYSDGCPTVAVKDRLSHLKQAQRCLRCTKKGHSKAECKVVMVCNYCKKDHHRSLCTDAETKRSGENAAKDKQERLHATAIGEKKGDQGSKESSIATTVATRGYIPTLRTSAQNPSNGEWELISTMLDSGADQTYLRKDFAEKWKLPNEGTETFNLRTFGSQDSKSITFDKTTIRIKKGKRTLDMKVLVSDNLAGRVWKARLTKDDLEHIVKKKMDINKDVFEDVVEPQLIIGCDYLSDLMIGNMITLPSGVKLIKTHIGFTTMGRRDQKKDPSESKEDFERHLLMAVKEDLQIEYSIQAEDDQRRDTIMKTANEFTGPMTEEKSLAIKETDEIFDRTVEKREEGYFVKIPFKEDHPELKDNFGIAIKRLQSVVRHSSNEVLGMIDKVIKDQLEAKFIEEVDPSEDSEGTLIRYNHHQPVLTPLKNTTKCRVVIDASSHHRGEPSLNDVIRTGDTILPDIVHMLDRFRSGSFAMVADVEKAFLQVFLHEEDRDVTRIIWLKDLQKPATKENLVYYRYTRVLFGLNISPYLLAATIRHHLKTHPNQELAQEILANLYVDNLILTSDENFEKLKNLYRDTKGIFNEMKMNLREYLSNSEQLNNFMDEKDKAEHKEMKVLGIEWHSSSDTIRMKCDYEDHEKLSRRTVSSDVASNFDPSGLLVPLFLKLKLFQRQLWNGQYGWDTELNEEHSQTWMELIESIKGYQVTLPRQIILKNGKNWIVTFTDASQDATACAIYVVNEKGASLIFGKSKVKPLK